MEKRREKESGCGREGGKVKGEGRGRRVRGEDEESIRIVLFDKITGVSS